MYCGWSCCWHLLLLFLLFLYLTLPMTYLVLVTFPFRLTPFSISSPTEDGNHMNEWLFIFEIVPSLFISLYLSLRVYTFSSLYFSLLIFSPSLLLFRLWLSHVCHPASSQARYADIPPFPPLSSFLFLPLTRAAVPSWPHALMEEKPKNIFLYTCLFLTLFPVGLLFSYLSFSSFFSPPLSSSSHPLFPQTFIRSYCLYIQALLLCPKCELVPSRTSKQRTTHAYSPVSYSFPLIFLSVFPTSCLSTFKYVPSITLQFHSRT